MTTAQMRWGTRCHSVAWFFGCRCPRRASGLRISSEAPDVYFVFYLPPLVLGQMFFVVVVLCVFLCVFFLPDLVFLPDAGL